MDAGRRVAYLEALGVEAWQLRRAVAADELRNEPPQEQASAEQPLAKQAPAGQLVPQQLAAAPASAEQLGAEQPLAAQVPAEAWASLRAEVERCTRCPLHRSRTQTVFGVGDPRAQWLVVGEAPGAEEDRLGEPFVGRGGQLLDAMLRGIGLARGENVYIANILKCRPPGNRDPKPEEVASCLPYLERQIGLIRPLLVLAVGRIAAQNLLGTAASLGSLRGRVHRFGTLNIPVVVTYHPAYLLRTPSEKRKAWEDLKFARSVFRELTTSS